MTGLASHLHGGGHIQEESIATHSLPLLTRGRSRDTTDVGFSGSQDGERDIVFAQAPGPVSVSGTLRSTLPFRARMPALCQASGSNLAPLRKTAVHLHLAYHGSVSNPVSYARQEFKKERGVPFIPALKDGVPWHGYHGRGHPIGACDTLATSGGRTHEVCPMVHQSTRAFLDVVVSRRQPNIRLHQRVVAHQGQRVAEGGQGLGGPGSLTNGAGVSRKQRMGLCWPCGSTVDLCNPSLGPMLDAPSLLAGGQCRGFPRAGELRG